MARTWSAVLARLGVPTGDGRIIDPAGEVINCRCSLFPVVLGEEIDWTDRQDP